MDGGKKEARPTWVKRVEEGKRACLNQEGGGGFAFYRMEESWLGARKNRKARGTGSNHPRSGVGGWVPSPPWGGLGRKNSNGKAGKKTSRESFASKVKEGLASPRESIREGGSAKSRGIDKETGGRKRVRCPGKKQTKKKEKMRKEDNGPK